MRVAVFASGSGTDLQALLDVCYGDAPAGIVLVVSNRIDARALDRARSANVVTAVLDDSQDGAQINSLLEQHEIDLVVCAGYLKLIPAETVRAYPGKIINIHPALLPGFGGPGMYGMRVHEAVLASGATVSGATVHLVTEEFDRGTIVAQWPVPVRADDSPESLADRVLAVEHRLLPAVVLAAGREGRVKRLPPHGSHYQLADDVDVQLQSA